MAANLKLPKLESPEVDQCLYQSMLGSLMYVAIGTCPNIMFAVHSLSQHSIAPGEEHLNTIKCVYHYLIRTRDLGLMFHSKRLNDNLIGFSDSDWAGDPKFPETSFRLHIHILRSCDRLVSKKTTNPCLIEY